MTPGFGLERPGLWAIAAPKTAVSLLSILLAAAVWLLPNLQFEEDINRVFLSQSERSQAYKNFVEATGGEAPQLVVLVEKPVPFDAADYAALRDFAFELEFIDGVQAALSPFAVRFGPLTALQGLGFESYADQPLIPEALDITTLNARFNAFVKTSGGTRPMLAADKKSLLFLVGLTAGIEKASVRGVIDAINSLSQATTLDKLTITLTGEPVIADEISRGLKQDLVQLNMLGSILVVLLALLYFRDWKLALLAVTPALLGALTSLLVFSVFGYPITVINNVVPLLVLILGIADSMHLVSHLRRAQEPDLRKRVNATVGLIGPACALTALTTSIAFFAIAITDNAQLFEFALAGGVSVLLSFFVVIGAFGSLAILLSPKASEEDDINKRSARSSFWLRPFVWLLSAPNALILAMGTVVFVAGALGYSSTKPWFPYEDHLPRSSTLKDVNARISGVFGGTYQLFVEVPISRSEGALDENSWQRLKAVEAAIMRAAPDYPVVSMVGLSRWLGDATKQPTAEELADVPQRLGDLLLPQNQSLARVLVQVPEPMRDDKTAQVQDALEAAALSAGASASVGLPIIMRHESLSIVSQLGRGLFLACLGACVVVAFAFRRAGWAILLLLPNLLPLVITGAGLHVFNQGHLTPTAVLALTIAFGIAVDDSIHFLNSYVQAKQAGLRKAQALQTAMHNSGTVILATTVLLCVGLTVTLLSGFYPVQLFGIMLMLTFVSAVFADLIFLPALLRLGDRDT